jgi:hypothetical protein
VTKRPLWLALLLVTVLPVGAERILRAVYFRAPAGAPEEVHVFGLEGNPALELPRMNLSDPLEIPAEDLRVAFTAGPVAEGERPPKGSPIAVIPAAWSQAVLVFFPDPENEVLPVKVMPVNASPRNFGPGDRYWLNLSKAVIAPRVGELRVPRILPGKTHIMKAPRGGARDLPVIVKCILPEDGQVRDLCRTTWRHDPRRRKLVFILPNPPRRVPRIWSLPFSDPPPDQPGKDS